ncbi:hypothetical protein MPER_01577, partial [Moniliophthora perniciosa FA553]
MPQGSPVLAASATLNAQALREVCGKLSISIGECFLLNLGNDRPNIYTEVCRMKSSTDFSSLQNHLPLDTPLNDMPKTIVFMNSLKTTQHAIRDLCKNHPELAGVIDYLYALRSKRDKKKVMKRFLSGDIKILMATEAAGMGADIPDIQLAVQFGVPSSLSVFKQRIGRAGRDPTLKSRAVFLVEQR